MTLFVKLLTLASLALAGPAAWASSSTASIQKIKKNYTAYRQAYDNEEQTGLEKTLATLKTGCKKCTGISCKQGSEMGETCALYCPYQKDCLSQFDPKIKSKKSFETFN